MAQRDVRDSRFHLLHFSSQRDIDKVVLYLNPALISLFSCKIGLPHNSRYNYHDFIERHSTEAGL